MTQRCPLCIQDREAGRLDGGAVPELELPEEYDTLGLVPDDEQLHCPRHGPVTKRAVTRARTNNIKREIA
jgi:hypothetical protein